NSTAPVDVVQSDRVTLLARDPGNGGAWMITENTPFSVDLSGAAAEAYFSNVEEKGLKAARTEAQSNPWVQTLGAALKRLPGLTVRVAPFISLETTQVLLQQVLGQVKSGKNAAPKKLQDAFATVASLPAPHEKFNYPELKKDKKQKPKTKPSPKRS